jgi:hypothetical protein
MRMAFNKLRRAMLPRKLLKKLLSGQLTPDEFRDSIMAYVEPGYPEEKQQELRKYSKQFDHICSFEDIYPDEDQLKDNELFITGRLSDAVYDKYIDYKYGCRKQM